MDEGCLVLTILTRDHSQLTLSRKENQGHRPIFHFKMIGALNNFILQMIDAFLAGEIYIFSAKSARVTLG
jgi:hypothetical protein